MLTNSLRIVIILGLTIVVFAQAYSWPLLVLYAGSDKASNGAGLLRLFALYVLVLAVNGITECFYYGAISKVGFVVFGIDLMADGAISTMRGEV